MGFLLRTFSCLLAESDIDAIFKLTCHMHPFSSPLNNKLYTGHKTQTKFGSSSLQRLSLPSKTNVLIGSLSCRLNYSRSALGFYPFPSPARYCCSAVSVPTELSQSIRGDTINGCNVHRRTSSCFIRELTIDLTDHTLLCLDLWWTRGIRTQSRITLACWFHYRSWSWDEMWTWKHPHTFLHRC